MKDILLKLNDLDNRAGAFQYILIKVLEAEGLLPEFVPVPWDKERLGDGIE